MKIGVFGGTSGVGIQFVKQALEQNHKLTVLARDRSKLDHLKSENLKIVDGDIMNRDQVNEVVKDQDIIVCSLGAKVLKGPGVDICSKGTQVIIDSMKSFGIKKIVTCSSLGVNESYKYTSYVTRFFIYMLLSKVIADKCIQEDIIRQSGIDYVIVRPPRLADKPLTQKYKVGFKIKGGTIGRSDVAHFMLSQCSSNEWNNQAPSITK